MRVSKTPRETGRRTLPEALLVEIIARLPLKSIARFKSVCKTLKSVIESTYFRSFFVSLHLNSLPSWSLIFKQLLSPRPVETFYYHAPVNIDEMLYMWKKDSDPTEPKVLIAHDFYGSETECRVIPLPVPYNENVKRCLTTSRGDVICIEILHRKLKIWRLNINSLEDGYWQLLTPEINMAYV
ncbi:unnamed protein product, partial [Arabidopsis halleri]